MIKPDVILLVFGTITRVMFIGYMDEKIITSHKLNILTMCAHIPARAPTAIHTLYTILYVQGLLMV